MNHQRLPGLDVLRALAIAWVMAYHLVSYGPFFGPVLGPIADLGWMGVDLFFVLSGFLVGGQVFAACAAPEGPRWGDYLLRRALRVLPAYLAVLALYLWLPGWRESPGMQPAWQFLSFTANLYPDYFRNRAFSHAWSLCVEEHFYLLLPLVVAGLSRRPTLRKSALFVLAVLLGGIAARAWAWHTQVAPWLHVNEGEDWFFLRYVEHVYNPSWNRLDGLLAGAALAAIRVHRPAWWRWMAARGWVFLAAGLLVVAAAARVFGGFVSAQGAVIGFPLLSLGLAGVLVGMASPRILAGGAGLPGARLLATLAFSLYLTHKAVFHLVDAYAGAWLAGSALLALVCHGGAALATAALLYLAVERPGLRLRERLVRGRVKLAVPSR